MFSFTIKFHKSSNVFQCSMNGKSKHPHQSYPRSQFCLAYWYNWFGWWYVLWMMFWLMLNVLVCLCPETGTLHCTALYSAISTYSAFRLTTELETFLSPFMKCYRCTIKKLCYLHFVYVCLKYCLTQYLPRAEYSVFIQKKTLCLTLSRLPVYNHSMLRVLNKIKSVHWHLLIYFISIMCWPSLLDNAASLITTGILLSCYDGSTWRFCHVFRILSSVVECCLACAKPCSIPNTARRKDWHFRA